MKSVITVILTITLVVVVGCGKQVHSSKEKGESPEPPDVGLHEAAFLGHLDAVRQHVEAGSDLNARDPHGSTPLITAIVFDKIEAALELIEAGADLTTANNDGATALHTAAFLCRTEIVRALLDRGANKYQRDNLGNTPLESVADPFDAVKGIYDSLVRALGPLGFTLDYERIKMVRPEIRELLRTRPDELEAAQYRPLPGADWQVSTPGDQGLDPELVAELYLSATGLPRLYSLLVVLNGYLIAERYFNEGSMEQKAQLQSVTKSYTSALVGIALEQKCLSSVDQMMIDFFPELAGQITDRRKERITIRNLLEMRGGYPWEETDPVLWDGLLSGRYPPLIEQFPLVADPGTEFNYSNLTSNWLGIIVARACGKDLKSIAQEHLFSPIGATVGDWGQDRDGHYNGCGGLHFSARDAAKFGLLYLNEGEFEQKQIVPADWVRKSLKSYSKNANSGAPRFGRIGRYFRDIGYGYQWWSARAGDHHFNYAAGHGGQLIVLLEEFDMVIVVTSAPFFLQHDEEAWKHEVSNINLVGKFIESLPRN